MYHNNTKLLKNTDTLCAGVKHKLTTIMEEGEL